MSNLAVLADEDGNFVGQKDRASIQPGDRIAVSSLWLKNSKGEVLIAQRSYRKSQNPGMWGPSAAGTLEPGETFVSNVVKEAEEEIGLIGVEFKEFYRSAYWRSDGDGRYVVWFCAVVDKPASSFRLQEEEVASVKWITKQELLEDIEKHPKKYVGTPERWKAILKLLG